MTTTENSRADALTAQAALAAIETFEIVGENNDSREPNADDRFILTEFIAHAFGGFTVDQPIDSSHDKAVWEYSYIHSSALGRGDEKIGPCLTYERATAFGIGCIEQRQFFISSNRADSQPAAAPCQCSGLGPCERRTDGSCRLQPAAAPNVGEGSAAEAYASCAGLLTAPSPADERAAFYLCTPKAGGEGYVIDRAPDSFELRDCDIIALQADDKSAFALVRKAILAANRGGDIDVCSLIAADHILSVFGARAASASQSADERAAALIEQHHRDSAELRRVCEARDEARRTAEYWKAEHNAANARIAELERASAKETGSNRAQFDAWFADAWAKYEDKEVTSEIKSKVWALKAWRHFACAASANETGAEGATGAQSDETRRVVYDIALKYCEFDKQARGYNVLRYECDDDLFNFVHEAAVALARSPAMAADVEGADALAHEVWSAAQRAPGEGIEDAVQRIATILSRSPAQADARPTDDELWDQTLRERDEYHESADKLAAAIAKHFGVDIGEHSNANCPWDEALEVIENAAQSDARVGLTDALRRAREELSIVEWENDPPNRVVKLFDEIDALLQGANHAE